MIDIALIDIALSKLLPNSADVHLTNCLAKHDFADWTLNGRVAAAAVQSTGKRQTMHCCCGSSHSRRGGRVACIHGYNGTIVIRLVNLVHLPVVVALSATLAWTILSFHRRE